MLELLSNDLFHTLEQEFPLLEILVLHSYREIFLDIKLVGLISKGFDVYQVAQDSFFNFFHLIKVKFYLIFLLIIIL